MVASSEYVSPRYGGWRRPDRGGLGSLSTAATVLLVLGPMFGVMIFLAFAWPPTLMFLAAWGAVMLLLLVRDRHGRTLIHHGSAWLAHARARSSKATLYRSGVLSRIPLGRHMLPGLLASTELSEHTTARGTPFALVRYPATRHYAVVIEASPDGQTLVDAETVDYRVAQWGHWLAALANEPHLHAAAVTIETTPDSGARLRRQMRATLDEDAPELSRQVYAEIMDSYPAGSAQVRAWVTLVFRGGTRRRRNAKEMALEISSRLPELTSNLQHVGAGEARPVTAQELCELVRVAYDPASAAIMACARADQEVPELSWDQVGPVTHEARWDHYVHDSAVSRTWAMTLPPRGEVYSHVLTRLLEPARGVDRKRLTMTYRPFDPARAVRAVEGAVDRAEFRVTGSARPTARAKAARSAARQAADEEARGAGLVQFDMLLTATVGSVDALPDATAMIDSLSASARVQLRAVNGSQDSAFAACLPLGVIPADHSRISSGAREAL